MWNGVFGDVIYTVSRNGQQSGGSNHPIQPGLRGVDEIFGGTGGGGGRGFVRGGVWPAESQAVGQDAFQSSTAFMQSS
jgi:hypothetical protein